MGGGGILWPSDLDSLTIFIWGGYSVALGFGLSHNFHWGEGGGILWHSDLDPLTIFIGGGVFCGRIGVNCRIWTKISTTPAGSCITDSLSHTTYVETKKGLYKIVWRFSHCKETEIVNTYPLGSVLFYRHLCRSR